MSAQSMSGQAKTSQPEKSQTGEPAKGGTKPADPKTHPSGDSPKPHGDKLEHAVDDAAKRK